MKGIIRLSWRQQRTAILVTLGLFALVVGTMVVLRGNLHADADSAWFRKCLNAGPGCFEDPGRFARQYVTPLQALAVVNMVLPALVGLFWGAPLLGRDAELGTSRLVLTQDTGRGRWFTARFTIAATATVLLSGGLTLLFQWWRTPTPGRLGEVSAGLNWYDTYVLDGSGPRVVTAALFGLAVGTAAGLLLRRVLPAMLVTFATVGVVGFALNFFRRTLVPPQVFQVPGGHSAVTADRMWPYSSGFVTSSGEHASARNCGYVEESPALKECMASHDYVAEYVKANPRGDFWTFQLLDISVHLVLAAALVALTAWLLRRRRI